MIWRGNRLRNILAAAAVCAAIGQAGLFLPRAAAQDAPSSLPKMSIEQLLTQLRQAPFPSPQADAMARELVNRGDAAYDELMKHFTARDEWYTVSVKALLSFSKFGDVLLSQPAPAMNPPALQQLQAMKANAVPALLRLMASPDETRRAQGLASLLTIARRCPDEADRQFTLILTAPAEVKPRLIAAQGLVTGLWAREAQAAAVQQLAQGDASMATALLAAMRSGGLPLDEAGAAWLKALQGATEPATVANLLQASVALRADDLPAAVPSLMGILKNLKPETDVRIRQALPTVMQTLKRAGKATAAALPELLRAAAAPARDAAIELCAQMGSDAAPVAANLAALLDAADSTPERKQAVLAAIAALGPAGRMVIPVVQRISDPALDAAKKHALLMLQDGWSPMAVADWKAARMRRARFTPRPSAEADLAAADGAVDALGKLVEANPAITPPAMRSAGLDGLFALVGEIDAACRQSTLRTGGFSAYTQAGLYAYATVAMLHAGKRDAAADDLNRAIARYRLAVMMDPNVAARMDFADVAIAQAQTGDVEGLLKLMQAVPVNVARLVGWQAAHQDLEGALETAMAVPYGPQRVLALAAAGVGFADAGRGQDAVHAYVLALDAAHLPVPPNESQIAQCAIVLARYSETGVTPAMLRGFYGTDDRDLSALARVDSIDPMLNRGLVDAAVALTLAAPPPDPNEEVNERLGRLGVYLHATLALVNNARRADVKAWCDKVHKEIDALYEAGAKRPAGRDAGFAVQYFNAVMYLSQTYINGGATRDATALLTGAQQQMVELQPVMGSGYDNVAGMMSRQLAQVGNFAAAQAVLEKLTAGPGAVNAWCALAEMEFPRDGAAAERSWKQAAGAGTDAAGGGNQTLPQVNASRQRASAGVAVNGSIRVNIGQRVPGQGVPPTGSQGKTLEDAAHAVADPAARITLIFNLAQQYQQLTRQPSAVVIERRLPPEYATLMREAETKLTGNTAQTQNLRAEALGVCILAGQIDTLDARVQAFATAVQNGPTLSPKAAATAPAPDMNNTPVPVLKALATAQGATGHAADAQKWIEPLTDAGLRAQLQFAVVRGAVLRVSDILLVSD